MTTARDDLAKSEAILVAAIEVNVPDLWLPARSSGLPVHDPLEDCA